MYRGRIHRLHWPSLSRPNSLFFTDALIGEECIVAMCLLLSSFHPGTRLITKCLVLTARQPKKIIDYTVLCKWLPLAVSVATIIILPPLPPVDVHSSNRCLIGVSRKLTATSFLIEWTNLLVVRVGTLIGTCICFFPSPGNRLAALPIASFSTLTTASASVVVAAVWLLSTSSSATCYPRRHSSP